MKYIITIALLLCVSVVGVFYLWRSAEDPVGSALVGAAEESSSSIDVTKSSLGQPVASPEGEAWRLKRSLDGVAFKLSPDNGDAAEVLSFESAMRAPVISDFRHRWSYAYDSSGAESNENDQSPGTSARLRRIGNVLERTGPDDKEALVAQLQATNDPLELALLAEVLETQSPGIYREAILDAALGTLADAAYEEDPQDEPYMGPLFDLLQKYGNESVVADLQQVPRRWEPYAAIALANMPRGEGVPALVDAVQGRRALRSLEGQRALTLLAQVSLEDKRAYETLVEKARTDVIPSHVWRNIAAVLAGDHQSQIEPPAADAALGASESVMGPSPYRTQTFYYGDGVRQTIYLVNQSAVLSAGEVEARLTLIDELKTETSNPTAIQALDSARDAMLLANYP